MKATYKIAEREYVSANQLYSKLERPAKYRYAMVIPLLLVISIISESPPIRYGLLLAVVGGILGHLVQVFLYIPWAAKRNYRNHKSAHEEVTVENQKEGLMFKSKNGEGILRWQDIYSWKENDELLLIYQSPNLYHIIPKSVENQGFSIDVVRESLKNYTTERK